MTARSREFQGAGAGQLNEFLLMGIS